jgi:asparagine synthase (glutamine-hydrolysing)
VSGIFGYLNQGTLRHTEPAFDSPVFRAGGSDCTIVADARVDYRDDLCKTLDLDPGVVSDPEVILAAYLRWGESCPDRLRGDFAFAIWDGRSRTLFCARDHFGVRPFYYHHAPGGMFVFASDARDILAVPEVPYAIDEGRVADFLVSELEWIDYTSTFYRHVLRLPPGHRMTVTPEGIRLAEYWTPTPGPALPAMSDRDRVDGLREVLTRAVAERLRSPAGNAGCMLSGGMDSGSVAALAAELLERRGEGPLRTFSAALGPDEECDETRRIHATVGMLGSDATMVLPDAIAERDEELKRAIEEPFDGDFLFMKAIYLTAREAGVSVLLDGGGGDIVLNEGAHVQRLARQGRLAAALGEALAESRFWYGRPRPFGAAAQLFKAATPEFIKTASRPWRQRASVRRLVAASMIDREFARQVDLDERFDRMHAMFAADWTADPALERVRKIRPNVSAGRERYGRLARFARVEGRDPFLDLNVVHYCARLPGDALLRHGWPKFILREAMAGRLPDDVRWGLGKPHIGWVFSSRFLQRELARGNLSLERIRSALGQRVDAAALDKGWEAFLRDGYHDAVNRAYTLALWLEQTAARPMVRNKPV